VLGGRIRTPEIESQRACRRKPCGGDYAHKSSSGHYRATKLFFLPV